MRTAFLALVFLIFIRTISAKPDCTRAEMEACVKTKQIFQDADAAASKDLTRVDTYTSRDDHDGTHCDDCCLYSKDGDPETEKGRRYAYCMDVGNCELCVDSCNITCSCQRPDQSCWEWEDCSTNTIEVGTACKAVCTENRNETKTFICEDANANAGLPAVQSTVSSLPNNGVAKCDAVWKHEGKMVTMKEIVMMGEETCSGYCEPMYLDDRFIVTCENWLNETMVFNSSEPNVVKSEGACIVKCKDYTLNNQTWDYYCHPPLTTIAPRKCGVIWHNNASQERTIQQIKDEIKDFCKGDTPTPPPLPPSTTPPLPSTTTPPLPPTTTPPSCKRDCTWPPFNDPLGTWDEEDCKLTCQMPPGGQICGLTARIPSLVAECSNQQWSYSTIIENGTEPIPDPTNYTDNDPYCPKPCPRPQTCPPSVLQGKPNPCKYICTVAGGVCVEKEDKIYTGTKCQLQCFNETVGPMSLVSGPKTTPPPPNRRKRQVTLPGDITTPIIETTSEASGITPGGITTPFTESTSNINGITTGGTVDNPMAEVLCNNNTQLIGADGKEYIYNEQDPQWVDLCDNTIVMVVSKMVYTENDIAGDFPLFNEKDYQEVKKPIWTNISCDNVMLDQWSRVSPKGLATGYDKDKDPQTISSFFRKPNPPNRKDPKPYNNKTRRMPDDDQFYHLLEPGTYNNTNTDGEVDVGGFPKMNIALQAYSEFTWKPEGRLNGENKTHGYYERLYQVEEKDQINHYFTDNFYLTVGEGELDPVMKRKLVRKVNIWVPIFDDRCFDYCGPDEEDYYRCRQECKPLTKTEIEALGVTVDIKCTTCDTDELVKYYYNSSQTQRNIWHDNLQMYPQGDDTVSWVNSNEKYQPMFTAVGPPGLWEVQCSVDPAKGPDYVTTNGSPNVQPQKRWLKENTLIPCSLNLKLNKHKKSVTNFKKFMDGEEPGKKLEEKMKLSLDWSLPNARVSGSFLFSYILFSAQGKGMCEAKNGVNTMAPVHKGRCDSSSGPEKGPQAKKPAEPQAVNSRAKALKWNCAAIGGLVKKNIWGWTGNESKVNNLGIGYALNERCCTQVDSIQKQCEWRESHPGNNMGVGPSTLVLTDKVFTDLRVKEDEKQDHVKHLLIMINHNYLAHLQSQIAVSVQYIDEATGQEKIDRINIERGVLHGRHTYGATHVMMCIKLNKDGQVIKMERPLNKWVHHKLSNHLDQYQYVSVNDTASSIDDKRDCGMCFDLFCDWNTIEEQDGEEVKDAKFKCCECAKKMQRDSNGESQEYFGETKFGSNEVVMCPWKGTFWNKKKTESCICKTGPKPVPDPEEAERQAGGQGSRSIKAGSHGPKDAREFEPQVLRLENDESPSEEDGGDDGGNPDKAEEGVDKEEDEGDKVGGDASSKEYLEEAEDVSYLGANQDIMDEAEENL